MKHKHHDLMIARANDANLKFEMLALDNEWIDCLHPMFNPAFEYRIKPNNYAIGNFAISKNSKLIVLITNIDNITFSGIVIRIDDNSVYSRGYLSVLWMQDLFTFETSLTGINL